MIYATQVAKYTLMDSREDLPRVSVGSVQDWQKMKNNYKEAALALVQQHTATSNVSSQEKDVLLAHLDQVCFMKCTTRSGH